MAKFIVDLYLDGYENEEEMAEACIEFMNENLDFSASSVDVKRFDETLLSDALKALEPFVKEASEWHEMYGDNVRPECDINMDGLPAEFTVGDLRTSAEVAARIKAQLGEE